jgi:hypothetical protein
LTRFRSEPSHSCRLCTVVCTISHLCFQDRILFFEFLLIVVEDIIKLVQADSLDGSVLGY